MLEHLHSDTLLFFSGKIWLNSEWMAICGQHITPYMYLHLTKVGCGYPKINRQGAWGWHTAEGMQTNINTTRLLRLSCLSTLFRTLQVSLNHGQLTGNLQKKFHFTSELFRCFGSVEITQYEKPPITEESENSTCMKYYFKNEFIFKII